MTIPGGPFLVAMYGVLGAVQVDGDALVRAPVMHGVDPAPRQIVQGRQVLRLCQHLRRESAHGQGRGRAMLNCPTAGKLAHHRITTPPRERLELDRAHTWRTLAPGLLAYRLRRPETLSPG